ncbi:MAG: TetR/AcrR family transcriptional regulator [Streptomyces sp.]|uniref:TetR/AcrR family transcriptional regulator n=1 Tax=Streptomyces sp. TaxID=1931 RepID=UPI003D6C5DD1
MSPMTRASGHTPARERLLEAAARVFYGEGIRSTPVDRVIAEAGVTRATLYRHFAGKEELVLAYVEARDQAVRANADAAAEAVDEPRDVLRALGDGVAAEICRPGFRGCPFINAAAEYPDPEHPVRRAVQAHRAWFHEVLTDMLARTGHPEPESAAHTLAMLRDGAMVAGYLETPDAVRVHLARAIETVLTQE